MSDTEMVERVARAINRDRRTGGGANVAIHDWCSDQDAIRMTRPQRKEAPMLDIEDRRIDNPLTTYAQTIHELDAGQSDAGTRRALVNMRTLVGGAHRFFGPPGAAGREMRLEACRIYKSTYEASQIGGARAVDPSYEPVDGGWLNPHAAFERGADARIRWRAITDAMDRVEMHRLRYVIVDERGPTAYARHVLALARPNASQIARATVDFRRIVDKLAKSLGLMR